MTKQAETDYLLPRDAAKTLGITTTVLRSMTDAGLIRCETTLGGHRRYRAHQLTPPATPAQGAGWLLDHLLHRALHAATSLPTDTRGDVLATLDIARASVANTLNPQESP